MKRIASAEEGRTYLLDKLSEDAFARAISSEEVDNIRYDVAYDLVDEGFKSVNDFVNQLDIKFNNRTTKFEAGYYYFDFDEDVFYEMFSPINLDPMTGHVVEIPEAESDGYYVGEFCAETWNSKCRPALMEQAALIDSDIDMYLALSEGDDEATELLWDEDGSPVYDKLYNLSLMYVQEASSVVEQAFDMIAQEYDNVVDGSEFIFNYLVDSEYKFDEDGNPIGW